MRIISVNTNGIRAAARKGFFEWLKKQNADVVCIQETKAQVHQLEDEQFHPQGYHCHYHDAVKKGYSGVAVYSKKKPKKVHIGIGMHDVDEEGRYIEVEFDKISVISLYMHSGSSSDERLAIKLDFMQRFMPYLQKLRRKRREFVICGDWNVAHKQIDLKNWRNNQKNSGFLPEERDWMTKLFDEVGYVDAFRVVNQKPHEYTWWSSRGQARANNTGWRIDYQIITPKLKESVKAAQIYKDESFSDHAPLIIDYEFVLE
ncbi:MAG: exodeoxyribonuclease III [Gammaproteobacteria bacterium]|nr:exodeoxyribonuclease III [Gammaproteobacteria bacterium]